MKNSNIPLVLTLFLFFLIPSCQWTEEKVKHNNEDVGFTSGDFNIAGELTYPDGEGPFPLVIMVHGDGPAYMNYFSKIKDRINSSGYASLMWDKPGFGKSTGEFTEKHLCKERSEILIDAVTTIQNHPKIQGDKIGVWGISQAGYVIPRALEKTDAIQFLILVGCGGENGIRQTAYYIKSQLMCLGIPEKEANTAGQNFKGLYDARNFDEYYKCAKPLVDDPAVREMGFVTAIWTKEQWKPKEKSDEGYFDPITIFEKIQIPALVFFGDFDKNVNPVQGLNAFNEAFKKAVNPNYLVKMIKGADHNIIISKTGCEKERYSRTRKEWSNYDPEYLKLIQNWLTSLNTD